MMAPWEPFAHGADIGLLMDLGCLYGLELETSCGQRRRLVVVPNRHCRFQLCAAEEADRADLRRPLGPPPAKVVIPPWGGLLGGEHH